MHGNHNVRLNVLGWLKMIFDEYWQAWFDAETEKRLNPLED